MADSSGNQALGLAPVHQGTSTAIHSGFQEVWRLRLTEPSGKKALWLFYHLLTSRNGFRQVAEVWAILFQRPNRKEEIRIDALKQGFELKSSFSTEKDGENLGPRIHESVLTHSNARGSVSSKGQRFEWDLSLTPAQSSNFNLIPDALSRIRLSSSRATTLEEDLRISGTTRINSEEQIWGAAHGSLSHSAGAQHWNSWTWCQCNSFFTQTGEPAYFIFEGMTFEKKIFGPLKPLRLNSFYFFYRGAHYRFNSFWRAIRSRSSSSMREWEFHVDQGELSFRGIARAENREFVGLTLEDTDGSLLYLSQSLFADMTIWIYRRGKLESTFVSKGTAALEIADRKKNPYLSLAF